MSNLINLTGKRFGRWIVLYKSFKRCPYGKHSIWYCRCDCGKEKDVVGKDLRFGGSKSCGCYAKEQMSKRLAKKDSGINALLRIYKKNAEKQNRIFKLSKKRFVELTQSNCYYCGVLPYKIIKCKSEFGSYIYNGIDRKDNKLGYTLKNCVPCCYCCNNLKWGHSHESFILTVKNIATHLKLC